MTETVATTSRSTRRRLIMLDASAAVGVLAGISSRPAAAQAPGQPLSIALPDFVATGLPDPGTARSVTEIIAGNLQRSGRFASIDRVADLEPNADLQPRFAEWQRINVRALVTGRLSQSEGRLQAQFRLWDVFAAQHLQAQQYTTTPDNWRRVAHVISDAIYERLTAEKGSFESSAPEITQP
jgi:TolB protein